MYGLSEKARGAAQHDAVQQPLPWVDKLVHLGNTVGNKLDGGQLDMKQKAARYIDKNCNINQEFHFAHPICKFQLNSIYNCHFSGCQTWDLFSHGADRFYSTYIIDL